MEYPGTLLRRGSSGDAVRAVQAALGVQQTAFFGPTTEECVVKYQRGAGLVPDGIVGPKTWAALFGATRKTSDLGLRALAVATRYIGTTEDPLGSNRGAFVDQVNRGVGAPLGSPWCMSFVQFAVKTACEEMDREVPIHRTASCSRLYRWAKAAGWLVPRPTVGDIFLCIGGSTGHYHTGFVASGLSADERFVTVEGNSNAEGDPNGTAVVRRRPGRRLASCHYVRL